MGCCESADAAERKPKGRTYMVAATADGEAEVASPRGGRTRPRQQTEPAVAGGAPRGSNTRSGGDWSDADDGGFDDLSGGAGSLEAMKSAKREVPKNGTSSTKHLPPKRRQSQGAKLFHSADNQTLTNSLCSFLAATKLAELRTLGYEPAKSVSIAIINLSERTIKYTYLFAASGPSPCDHRVLLLTPVACSLLPKPTQTSSPFGGKKMHPEAVFDSKNDTDEFLGGGGGAGASTNHRSAKNRAPNRSPSDSNSVPTTGPMAPAEEFSFHAGQVAHNLRWGATHPEDVVIYVDPYVYELEGSRGGGAPTKSDNWWEQTTPATAETKEVIFCPGRCIMLDARVMLVGSRSLMSVPLPNLSSPSSLGGGKTILRFPSATNNIPAACGLRFLHQTSVVIQVGRTDVKLQGHTAAAPPGPGRTIGSNFFRQSLLSLVDLSSSNFLLHVEWIGDFCLANCPNLTEADFGAAPMEGELGDDGLPQQYPCQKLRHIGNSFMEGAKKLRRLDLSHCTKLEFVGSDFLAGAYSLEDLRLPKVEALECKGLDVIHSGFLRDCNRLKYFDLGNWCKRASFIGDFVCYQCVQLQLPSTRETGQQWNCRRLLEIGKDFLRGCHALEGTLCFDAEPTSFPYLKSIGDGFVSECNNLKSINFAPMYALERIGDDFCYGCSNLVDVTIQDAPVLGKIENYFLAHCANLEVFMTGQPLTALDRIGNGAFFNCPCLVEPSLYQFPAVKGIGHGFCCSCLSLESPTIPEQWPEQMEGVGSECFRNCQALTGFTTNMTKKERSSRSTPSVIVTLPYPFGRSLKDLGPLMFADCTRLVSLTLSSPLFSDGAGNLQKLPDWFCFGCVSLESLDLRGPLMASLLSIGSNFATDCPRLVNVELGEMSRLTSIGDSFLKGSAVEKLDFTSMGSLRSFGHATLASCHKLVSLNCSGLRSLVSIGNHFLSECFQLQEFNATGLVNLTQIDDYFLYRCRSLMTLDNRMMVVRHVGEHFLEECDSLDMHGAQEAGNTFD